MFSLVTASIIVGCAAFLVKTSDINNKPDTNIKDLNDIFKEKKVKNFKDQYACISSRTVQKTFTDYEVSIPLGKTIKDIEDCIPAIETHFKNNASVEKIKKSIVIRLYTTDLADQYYFKPIMVNKEKGLQIFLGNSREGEIIENLSVNPHLSVVGSTGAGKSVFVNCILCNLLETYTADELGLILFDLKGNELNEYKDLEHTVYHTVKVEETIQYFSELRAEMERRYVLLGNYRDINSYNKANPNHKMKYLFIVIEECFSLLQHKNDYNLLGDIMSKARAAGMHFLLTTQRPAADIIPKVAYTHVTTRVGLKTNSIQESKNAIEIPGLERINEPGVGIMNVSGKYIYFKSSYISEQKIEKITKKYRKKASSIVIDPVKEESKSSKRMMFDLEGDL